MLRIITLRRYHFIYRFTVTGADSYYYNVVLKNKMYELQDYRICHTICKYCISITLRYFFFHKCSKNAFKQRVTTLLYKFWYHFLLYEPCSAQVNIIWIRSQSSHSPSHRPLNSVNIHKVTIFSALFHGWRIFFKKWKNLIFFKIF